MVVFTLKEKEARMDLLDLLLKLSRKEKELEAVFGKTDFLSGIIRNLEDMVLDMYGVPKEEKELVSSDDKFQSFTRNGWYLLLSHFEEGKIFKKELTKKLGA